MTNQGKMVVITTSNEDLISQVSSNKCIDTHIIDLNENKSNYSISKDNQNFLDLTFLAQLSELNSSNDQMYKRVLNSPRNNRSKMLKTSKKGVNLLCVICEDRAIGFNYDALTCASCKAFFRRNAQYNPEKLRCLTGEKNCIISHEMYRKCQRCRLSKCLSMGMRRDFILSEEEKQKRKQRIEENRQLSYQYYPNIESISTSNNSNYLSQSIDEIDQLLMDTDNDNIENRIYESLSIEDWCDIENIRSSYISIFQNGNLSSHSYEISDHISALITWSQFASERSIKLINFCRQIDEFENLNNNDKFILIKYNLLSLYIIQKSLLYNPLTGKFECKSNDDPLKRRQFFTLCYGASNIRERFKNLIHSFTVVAERDSTLIYLILIICIFSKGLSMSENESYLTDSLTVYKAQSHYTKLIWNYLLYKHGYYKTSIQFIQLMDQITKIQSYTKCYREFFRGEIQSEDALQKFAPLMQAVLDIS